MTLRRARTLARRLARALPFLAEPAHGADLVLDVRVGAAAVDVVHRRIALNPTWCGDLSDDELSFVLAHELMHIMLRTGPRGEGADAIYWNFAHDMVINQRLTRLLRRPPPRGGVTLPGDELLDAETVYLRAQQKGYLDELRSWVHSRWQVDAHPDSSAALANQRAGHGSSSISGDGTIVSYVAVEYDASSVAGEYGAIVETTKLRRPWPKSWLAALQGGGVRGRSWSRPSRRSSGALVAGRHRVIPDHVDVLFDVTPAMLPHAANTLAMLRAFAADHQLTSLRVLCVDEWRIVADEVRTPAALTSLRLPRALVVQKSSSSKLEAGMWICAHCERPHAAARPCTARAAFAAVPLVIRDGALVIETPRR